MTTSGVSATEKSPPGIDLPSLRRHGCDNIDSLRDFSDDNFQADSSLRILRSVKIVKDFGIIMAHGTSISRPTCLSSLNKNSASIEKADNRSLLKIIEWFIRGSELNV